MSKLSYILSYIRVKWNIFLIKVGLRKYELSPRGRCILQYFREVAKGEEHQRIAQYEEALDYYCSLTPSMEREDVASFVADAMEEMTTGNFDVLNNL